MNVRDITVIAPNFKRRLSGVTSTIVQLVPLQARSLGIAALGPGLPKHLPKLSLRDLPLLWSRPAGRPFRIWHARRNVEMLAGIVLRDVLRMPIRLVFTSAAQRHHTGWTRRLIRRMDAVIATSGRSAGYLTVPAEIVLHGIDLGRFHPAPSREAQKAELGLAGRRLIGCSGRIRLQKGTDLFVDAMIAILPRYPEWTAIVTGRATAEHAAFDADLRRRVAAAGLDERIRFLGEVADVTAWFRAFDLYVAPPRNEGFGLTPLEAMASGAAVVASDAGAFQDMIIEGETGRIVPVGDEKALAAAVEAYLSDPEALARAGASALAHVRAKFPLEREAAEIQRVYERLWSAADHG